MIYTCRFCVFFATPFLHCLNQLCFACCGIATNKRASQRASRIDPKRCSFWLINWLVWYAGDSRTDYDTESYRYLSLACLYRRLVHFKGFELNIQQSYRYVSLVQSFSLELFPRFACRSFTIYFIKAHTGGIKQHTYTPPGRDLLPPPRHTQTHTRTALQHTTPIREKN